MNVKEFIDKWGTRGWRVVLEKFIEKSPEFSEGNKLAMCLGEFSADLEYMLQNELEKIKKNDNLG